ncbi:HAD family hydrolase [Prescottella sp. R16]|uniref:HAD family hydrolase n=1 Tax=Prescottella sp. R16 TaxID=3064529 RepID=UPI00272E0921|nr:HAD family hydrolase [Prescottella sp. R16]
MIYSRTAAGDGFEAAAPVCVEIYDDAPLSYMTGAAHGLLADLAGRAAVVPTTTRTPAQYGRITLPGGPYRYAVTSNGGAILVDGRPDEQWRRSIDRRVAAAGPPVTAVTEELRTRIDERWVRSLRVADDLFCYLVVDVAAQPAEFVAAWRAWCAPRGWNVSQQGRKIYTMPNAVTKSAALHDVHGRLVADGTLRAGSRVVAAGDGVLDIDLLVHADTAIRPRHGELEDTGWQHPTVTVTTGRGIRAGEEILTWFHQHTAHPETPFPQRMSTCPNS